MYHLQHRPHECLFNVKYEAEVTPADLPGNTVMTTGFSTEYYTCIEHLELNNDLLPDQLHEVTPVKKLPAILFVQCMLC